MKRSSEGVPLFHQKGIEGQYDIFKSHALSAAEMKVLKTAKFPILTISGDSDIMITADNSYRMPTLIGAKLVLIGGAGHGIYYQCPDEFNRQIELFIDENFGAASASNSGRFKRSNSITGPVVTVNMNNNK